MARLNAKWFELLELTSPTEDAHYRHCYPEHLLKLLAQRAYEGVLSSGSAVAAPRELPCVAKALNDAWGQFWQHPTGYLSWEQDKIKELKLALNF